MEWKGWTAGIIDGEGTITISPRKRSDGTCKYDGHIMRVIVGNTDERMITKLIELWGGSKYHKKFDALRPNRCEAWLWTVTATKAQNVLCQIRPYLISKAEKADIAIEMQRRISEGRGFNGPKNNRGSGLTQDEINYRNQLVIQMKKLNIKPGVKLWQGKNETG